MKSNFFLIAIVCLISILAGTAHAKDWVTFEGHDGPGHGKTLVFLTGDEEYRSEEGLPQLAQILAERHGFKCTVLFAINPTNHTIDPNYSHSLPGAEAIDSADVIIMGLRFRSWPDEQMKHFVDAYLAGKPFIGLRTSTHAFAYDGNSTSPYAKYSYNSTVWPGGFGRQVLGETWVDHLGQNHREATRGIIEPAQKDNPLLRGVGDIFGDTGIYHVEPQADSTILVRGQVLDGVHPNDPPLAGKKNNPLQPLVWSRISKNEAGTTNKTLCTTMGAATDLQSEGLRRLIVNGVYWAVGLDIPEKADVTLVGDYHPSAYSFNGFIKGRTPDVYAPK